MRLWFPCCKVRKDASPPRTVLTLILLLHSIFSEASSERIQAAALFLVWIFIWDDEIDHGEGENGISIDGDLARRYCTESLEYMSWCLGLSGNDQMEPVCKIPNMPLFKDLACFLREGMDVGQLPVASQDIRWTQTLI